MQFFLDAMTELGCHFASQSGFKIQVFFEPSRNIWVATGGHGKVEFALQTQYLVEKLRAQLQVICLGSAGGLDPQLKVGDVVLGSQTIEHDYKQRFGKISQPVFAGNIDLIERLRSSKTESIDNASRVLVGSIASGDEDIIDTHRAEELFKQTGALAVAWEGAGGARACQLLGVPFLEVRAISDNARHGVAESFTQNLAKCMHNAARLIAAVSQW